MTIKESDYTDSQWEQIVENFIDDNEELAGEIMAEPVSIPDDSNFEKIRDYIIRNNIEPEIETATCWPPDDE